MNVRCTAPPMGRCRTDRIAFPLLALVLCAGTVYAERRLSRYNNYDEAYPGSDKLMNKAPVRRDLLFSSDENSSIEDDGDASSFFQNYVPVALSTRKTPKAFEDARNIENTEEFTEEVSEEGSAGGEDSEVPGGGKGGSEGGNKGGNKGSEGGNGGGGGNGGPGGGNGGNGGGGGPGGGNGGNGGGGGSDSAREDNRYEDFGGATRNEGDAGDEYDIDCSHFADWDVPPPGCRPEDQDNEGEIGFDERQPEEEQKEEQEDVEKEETTVSRPRDANIVSIPLSVGLMNLGDLVADNPIAPQSEEGSGPGEGLLKRRRRIRKQSKRLINRVMTELLDKYAPFMVALKPPTSQKRSKKTSPSEDEDQGEDEDDEIHRMLKRDFQLDSENDHPDPIQRISFGLVDNEEYPYQRTLGDAEAQVLPQGGAKKQYAQLYHHNTTLRPIKTAGLFSNFENELDMVSHTNSSEEANRWYLFKVRYRSYWMDNKPVVGKALIRNITHICSAIVNATIVNGDFWKELNKVEKDGDFVVLGVAVGGHEYPIPDGPPKKLDSSDSAESSDSTDSAETPSFAEPLSMDGFDDLQWIGMIIFTSMLFLSGLLSTSAAVQKRRYANHRAWSSPALTEQGVGKMLEVGWRYQCEDADDNASQPQDPQLFLQVYNKSKLGYNDDNSMLLGEAIHHQYAHPQPVSSNTAPTSGPTSSSEPRSSLPRSSISLATPDNSSRP